MKEVTMPKLSDTMTEGAVVVWRKSVGARVERGEVIAEVETDKATMELEAFASGILLEIRVEAGTTVPVGTVIGVIGEQAERPVAQQTVPPETPPAAKPEPEAEPPLIEPAAPGGAGEVLAAPVVRRRAKELGIDLAAVAGSGPGGRVLLEDLAAATDGQLEMPREKVVVRTAGKPTATTMGITPPGEVSQLIPSAAQPLTRMRAAIARTVEESWRTIPHFSVAVEVRMDAAEQFRHRLKEQYQDMSLTALLVKATTLSLQKFPRLNASLVDNRLAIHPEINVGIVVRRDDGLLVPVLRDCAKLSLAELAQRTGQLVEGARRGQLSHTELSGGTFAISNLGMYEVHSFVALILPPMAAVLAVGAVRDAVVANEGQPVVGRLLSLNLSADHRIVDGAYAAEFLQLLKRMLEQPGMLAG